MRVAFGTDERTTVTDRVETWLTAGGHELEVVLERGSDWPDVGTAVAQLVADGTVDRGVVCCWTGTGVTMAANKVSGARAALCTDPETARGARLWNDANVLGLSLRLTSEALAEEILDQFFGTDVDPDEAEQIAKLR